MNKNLNTEISFIARAIVAVAFKHFTIITTKSTKQDKLNQLTRLSLALPLPPTLQPLSNGYHQKIAVLSSTLMDPMTLPFTMMVADQSFTTPLEISFKY